MSLLRVQDLYVDFPLQGGTLTAVNGVGFEVDRGETFGIVGESGSGKTVTALSIMGLLDPPAHIRSGHIQLADQELVGIGEREWERLRGRKISMVFQEPMTALNPVLTIGEQIVEVYQQHLHLSGSVANRRAADMLRKVRIADPERTLRKYPYELSGGMRQRVLIAAALAGEPDLLICDEPTTALDVTIQSQILKLLQEIQAEFGMALIFISHNLGVVAQICERVAVMYAGEIVEEGPTEAVLRAPAHPYTAGLLASVPRRGQPLQTIRGSICDLLNPPSGCRFHPHCPQAAAVCSQTPPRLEPHDTSRAACYFPLTTAAPALPA